jgi:hypothetical protein
MSEASVCPIVQSIGVHTALFPAVPGWDEHGREGQLTSRLARWPGECNLASEAPQDGGYISEISSAL